MDFRRPDTQTGILSVVDRLQRAQSLEAVEHDMLSFISAQGCECFLISRMPDEACGSELPLLISGRYSAEWLRQYQEERLYLHDPVTARVKVERLPFRWSELVVDRFEQAEAWRALGSFRAFGKFEGVSVPVAGPKGFRGYVSMAGKRVNTSPDTMPALQMVSLFAFGAVERIIRGVSRNGSHVLSDREREVLRWIADGRSQEQVGDLLSISERTVEEHVRNVRRKLGAVNTAHAVAQALLTGEIQL